MYEWLLPIVGFGVGVLVAMTGVGGGSIMTPLLLILGIPPISAVGTDLVHSAVSKALGAAFYWRGRVVSLLAVAYLMAGSLVALVFGGYFIVAIRAIYGEATLNYFVSLCIAAILMVAGASFLLLARAPATDGSPRRLTMAPTASVGFLIGLAINITSVGAGSMLMPYLMRNLKSKGEMVGTDLAFGFLTTLSGAVFQLNLGTVLLLPLILLLAGSVPGTYVGVKLNHKIHIRHMRLILSVLILLAGVSVLVKILS